MFDKTGKINLERRSYQVLVKIREINFNSSLKNATWNPMKNTFDIF
jgi:hypothetical protein